MKRRTKPSQFPELVRIGKRNWHVIFVDTIAKGSESGNCIFKNRLILIALDQDPKDYEATFWHEVLHAWEYETGLELGHPRINKLEWLLIDVREQFPG